MAKSAASGARRHQSNRDQAIRKAALIVKAALLDATTKAVLSRARRDAVSDGRVESRREHVGFDVLKVETLRRPLELQMMIGVDHAMLLDQVASQ